MATYRIGTLTRNLSRITIQTYFRQQNYNVARSYASKTKPPRSTLRLGMLGVGMGTVIGVGWSGYNEFFSTKSSDHKVHERSGPTFVAKMPDVKVMRKIVNSQDDSELDLVLFQFQTCPFCCKVRAFLDHTGLSYSVVEVDAVLRQSIKWSDSKKVPILLARTKDGRYVQLNDSSMIISTLASFLKDKSQDIGELAKFYPSISFMDDSLNKKFDIMNKYFLMLKDQKPQATNKELEEERKWREWADSKLVHLISPNVYRSKQESLETFEWFSDVGEWSTHFPSWERNLMVYLGAAAMYLISKRLKKRHGLSDDVRSHIYDACDEWTKALDKKKTTFMGGKKPNLADLAVFGVLNSMEGCEAFKDCLENTNIGGWFYSVKEQVMRNRGNVLY